MTPCSFSKTPVVGTPECSRFIVPGMTSYLWSQSRIQSESRSVPGTIETVGISCLTGWYYSLQVLLPGKTIDFFPADFPTPLDTMKLAIWKGDPSSDPA